MPSNPALPPPDVTPARLFAVLVDPSPSRALESHLSGADDERLFVRPVPALELAAARVAAQDHPVPELRRSRYTAEIVARCVWTGGARAFASVAEVGVLDALELAALGAEVLDALATIGPTYARSDWPAWQEVLARGAKDPANASTAIALAGCADYGHGAVTFRPDRFWGVPIRQLLDGHWMAYRAARAAWIEDSAPAPRTVADALRAAQMERAKAEANRTAPLPSTSSSIPSGAST